MASKQLLSIRPKKHLGQHFLINETACQRIADAIPRENQFPIIEIGPGTGALTRFLLRLNRPLTVVEYDIEAIQFLNKNYPLKFNIIHDDVLKTDWHQFGNQFNLAGNLPYNISTQVLFKVFENRNNALCCVFMLQKEVAERLASPPGYRQYGILSVLLQAFYNIELLFTLSPSDFYPPPEVHSSVIKMNRNAVKHLNCDEKKFITMVKTAFNQRRKKLSNALKSLIFEWPAEADFRNARAEELSWQDFEKLTSLTEKK
ncbi:MAG: ribosomal RNA small subunit methyltransferase A [Bacteroidia bacterium]|nr:ribosomal RNA small subunit methyltransferase A [Bacteroidia bacterium]